eukprot:TRINITY_DN100_c0_g1_i1.p1 TRINITY_DN100_c0_g1~~TRINITY_DN100_c0_g1_i1.p1  ORF type:complete len:741 (-),score=107.41 TRINITY_DN100_c0_g1_i1:412-2634(-)
MPKYLENKHQHFYFSERRRRYGLRPYPGDADRLHKKFTDGLINIPYGGYESKDQQPYFQSNLNPFYRVQVYRGGKRHTQQVPISATGGIYNLEFSPDGRILSAACEKRNILIFDPLTRQIVQNLENAHQDCVNCVRFLDTRTFASCSDDHTVALWDVRHLKTRIRNLRGHDNWVKNIEFSRQDNLLVTSGFDGAIYTWEFNKYSESGFSFKKVFHTSGLMRMRLTPCAQKMVISTMNGYLMVVHDLDLATLPEDLAGFQPTMYRNMQETGRFEIALKHTKLFHAKRNRVELISDFPEGNEAEIISSLRLHPQGWVAVTRNTSSDEKSEWCCVHDIQTIDSREDLDVPYKVPTSASSHHQANSGSASSHQANPPRLSWSISLPVGGGEGGEGGGGSNSPPPRDVENPPSSPPGLFHDPSDSDEDDDAPIVQRFRSGNIQIISTGMPTSQENNSGIVQVNFSRLRAAADSNPPERNGERERDVETAESVDVDGTNFIAAETLRALDVIRDTEANNGDNSGPNIGGVANGQNERRMEENQQNDPRVPPIPGGASGSAGNNGPPSPQPYNPDPGNQGRRLDIAGMLRIIVGDRDATFRGGGDMPRRILITHARGRGTHYFGSPAARRAQQAAIPKDAKIHHNSPRLMHFIEESNTGRGFIKEQCFSPCGRIIASPFAYGVRLLGWNSECSDLSDCVPTSPVQLYEFGTKASHSEVVVSTAFNPSHWQLVTGCLGGRISWHTPVI